jgi:hypothetical protein
MQVHAPAAARSAAELQSETDANKRDVYRINQNDARLMDVDLAGLWQTIG